MRTECGPDAKVGETLVRVRYAETDQMGVVYHSNYFIWFEIGRVELMREIGYSYNQMELDGYRLPVADVHCRYKLPARYDDVLLIRSRIINLRPTLLRFGYEAIRHCDGALLAEGETTHIVVGREKKKVQLPEKYMNVFRLAMGAEAKVAP